MGHPEALSSVARDRAGTVRLVVILGALAAFAPLSFDMYLPAFPALATDFDTSASAIQLSLTACLVGVAAGQLVFGSLSDARGRRGPLLVGLAVYTVASALCALAPDAVTLAGLRFAQGVAAGAAVVASRAVVRDLHSGTAAARFFSSLMLVNGLAPVLAPSIGSAVLEVTTWEGIFLVLAATGVLLFAAVALGLPETLPRERRREAGLRRMLAGFGEPLRDRWFVGHALAQGFAVSAVFAYIAGSSFVLQDVYGLSPRTFGLVFGLNGIGILACSQLNRLLLRRARPRQILLVGLAGSAGAGVCVLAAVAADAPLGLVLAPLFVGVATIGIVMPNATALALTNHPHVAGSASALIGTTQFAIAAVVAPLVGIAGRDTALPLGIALAVLGTAALVTGLVVPRRPVVAP
ncbi:MAG TPA: multidrug effflux MFS transporter [Gaiella sp.]|nr:multidrug effflux MFS transporter [Gaiella sp.]